MRKGKRQSLHAGAFLAWPSSMPSVAASMPTPPLLVVLDIATLGARAAYQAFAAAVHRRFAAARFRPKVRFITADADETGKNVEALKEALLAARADIILAANSTFARMAGKFGLGKPILFFSLADRIENGLTDSLTRPGMGMTGFTLGAASNLKRQEMLLRLAPRCRILGRLSSSAHRVEGLRQPSAGLAVLARGIEERKFDCDSLEQLPVLLKSRAAREVDAWAIEYTFVASRYPEEIVRQFGMLRRPMTYPRMKHVHLGGIAAFEPSIEEADDAWVSQVASLLAGVPIADIPVVQATRYKFGLNLKTCRQVGVDPPKSLIKIADLVIE